jgi:hypothetical protein
MDDIERGVRGEYESGCGDEIAGWLSGEGTPSSFFGDGEESKTGASVAGEAFGLSCGVDVAVSVGANGCGGVEGCAGVEGVKSRFYTLSYPY